MGESPVLGFCFRTWAMRCLAVVVGVLLPLPALAVVAPPEVEPSRIAPGVTGPGEPHLKAPGEALPVFPENLQPPPIPNGEAVRFTLQAVVIAGATVYSEEQLKALYTDSLGKTVSLADMQAIAERITARYRNDGYILSQAVVPRQDLRNGTLRIRVVEGFVDGVIVEGDGRDADARGLVQRYGAKITEERPLRISTLERYLLLMNDLPGMTARGVLQPSADAFGAANLVVTLTRKRLDGLLATDNRITRYFGALQQTATLAANSLAGLDERTQIQAGMADPAHAMRMLDLRHEEQLDGEGTRLVLEASQTSTRPALALVPLDLKAVSNDLQLAVQHPFLLRRSETLTGRMAFDYRNTDTTVFSGTPLTSDRVRALRLGGNYTFADRWQGTDLLDVQASHGLNLFNASASGEMRSQPAAPADFTRLNLNLSRTQALPMGFSLFTAFSGQVSADPLLAAEQFTLGGPAFGSAYDPGTLAGDEGAAARAELRYEGQAAIPLPLFYQAYGFYDVGAVWDKIRTPDKSSLASAGLGVRFGLARNLSGMTEVAVPLTKKADLAGDEHAPRLFFGLTAGF